MFIPWKYQKNISFAGENQKIISNRSHPDASKNPTTNFSSLTNAVSQKWVFEGMPVQIVKYYAVFMIYGYWLYWMHFV